MKPETNLPTQAFVSEAMEYNAETGVCTWRVRPLSHFNSINTQKRWNGRFAGKRVGGVWNIRGKSYVRVFFCGGMRGLHRLIWLLVTGAWPDVIDHKDGNGLNNRLENLQNTNALGNNKNKAQKKNRVLPNGIVEKGEKFAARIGVDKRTVYLGSFETVSEAVAARSAANKKYGFSENHGIVI